MSTLDAPPQAIADRSGKGATRAKRILAVASGGGHWADLCRLYPIFAGLDVAFVSVHTSYASQVSGHRFYVTVSYTHLTLPTILRV